MHVSRFKSKRPAFRAGSLTATVILFSAVLLVVSPGSSASNTAKPEGRQPNAQDLQVVDCLLPGQVRRLGANQTYVSRRRPMRTTALDCGIRGGEYVSYDRANYETALKVWLETAEAGDPQSQYYVGEIYERGLGTAPDYAKAAEWYRKAADQGYTQSQINLGFLYEKGLGVPQDPQQALALYRKAAGVSGVIMLDSEIAAIRKELAESNDRLKSAQASRQTLEASLQKTRGDLEKAKASGKQAASEAAALATKVSELEGRMASEGTRIAQLQTSMTKYDIAGPTIEVIDTTAVRDAAGSAPDPSGEIVGRVDAPAGLSVLTVDGERLPVQDGGFFRFKPRSRRMTLVAVDLQGKRGQLVHDLDARAAAARAAARPAGKLGAYHALIIGNDQYPSMSKLTTAVNDAKALDSLLSTRYGFRVTLLQNATYLEILSAFSTLRKGLKEEDNLLIYYAGHGALDAAGGLSYWLPVDAREDNRTNWMSSREVGLQLGLLPSRHILVVSDSCYSGALTRSALARLDDSADKDRSRRLGDLLTRRSRTALTSGGLEPVLDAGGGGHSIFARSLIDALSKDAGTMETYRLWSTVRARVMYETRTLRREQVPEYAPIQFAGHEGGDFVFVPARS
jgi:hypothetical protein